MTRLQMSAPGLAVALVLGLAACAVPPDGGQAAGPTESTATATEPVAVATVAPSPPDPTPGDGAPSATPTASPTATPTASPTPAASATAPARPSEAPDGTVTAPSNEPAVESAPEPAPPAGAAGPPALPTLPDHVVAAAAGRGPGAAPPEVPGRPSDLAPGERGDLARAWAGAQREDWRVLAGFVGSQWDQQVTGAVEVVAGSVAIRDGVATGLVRNGRAVDVGPIVVRAGGAEAEALVPVARPGEPVPFRLEVGDVAPSALTWSASARRATSNARDLFLVTWWQRGVADPRPVDTALWSDPPAGPRPMVVFGSATAVRGGMADVEVAAAWIDDDGRVIGVAEGVVGQATVSADGAADFVVATTGPDDLDGAHLMLWGWGR